MNVQSETAATGAETPPERRRPSRRTIVLTVVVVLGVVAVLLAVRWWTHPTLFHSLGDRHVLDPRPVDRAALSTTVVFPRTEGEAEEVTLRDLDATFRTNTAEADVTFHICRMAADGDVIGSVHNPRQFCEDLEPFEADTAMTYGVTPQSDYLLATITPTQPGVAHLTHVELTYALDARHLWRRGTQTIEVDRKITAR